MSGRKRQTGANLNILADSVLGCMLLNPADTWPHFATIAPEDFPKGKHRNLADAMRRIEAEGGAVAINAGALLAETGGTVSASWIGGLTETVLTSAGAEYHAKELRKAAQLARAQRDAETLRHALEDGGIESAGEILQRISASLEVQCDGEVETPKMRQAAPYPMTALGKTLGSVAGLMCDAVCVPPAMAGQSVLAAASLATQPHANVLIDGRTMPLSIFALTVAESGDRKSAVDKFVIAPHADHESELRRAWGEALARYRAEREAYETAKREAVNRTKKKGREAIEEAIRDLGAEPLEPAAPVLLLADFTVEGVRRAFTGNHSIGLFTDEGGKMTGGHAMLRENSLKTLTTLSSLWDGRNHTVARGGDGIVVFEGKRCALHLMLQPEIAPGLFDDAQAAGQGFLWRCLPAWPDTLAGTRNYRAVDLTGESAYRRYHKSMIDLLTAPLPLNDSGILEPRALPLAADAKAAWIAFHDHVEFQQAPGKELAHLKPFGSKLAEHALRVAGVLALVDDAGAMSIDLDTMARAIKLAEWYLREMDRIRNRGNMSREDRDAAKLLTWWQKQDRKEWTFRELLQYGPNALRTKAAMEDALAILAGRGVVICIDGGGNWGLAA